VAAVSSVSYQLCECPEHGTVCAKHFNAVQGGGGEVDTYDCPGVPGDTGGCNQLLTPLGQRCDRPAWAEYGSDPR